LYGKIGSLCGVLLTIRYLFPIFTSDWTTAMSIAEFIAMRDGLETAILLMIF